MKKYELTNESCTTFGRTLYRIRALTNFCYIAEGTLGGWVESEDNLSQDGNAWVYDDAVVYGDARVYGDAHVHDRAMVHGGAQVYGSAHICSSALVCDHARVYDHANVGGNALVAGLAEVHGGASVRGNACIRGDAKIQCDRDILVVGPLGSRGGYTTFFRGFNGDIHVACGCFGGSIRQFAERIVEIHGDFKYAKEYLAAVELAKIHMGADHE